MLPEIIKTEDGSHSLYIKELDEHYHSIHGAVQESRHVFIEAGLKHFISGAALPVEIKILEIGLGTGLNALLTFIEAEKSASHIYYTAVEAYPLSIDLAGQLNYIDCLNAEKYQSVFNAVHSCEWDKPVMLSNQFTIRKIKNTIQQAILENKYDLIYFDAFGPPVQPEMWIEEVFAKIYAAMADKGYLVTYCAKGEVKRTLKKVGFAVESLKGPPGKREMVRAQKVC